MTSTWQQPAAALVADLQGIFAGRLRSVVAYGSRIDGEGTAPLSCLALVDSLGIGDLEACARLAHAWERHGLTVPLLLPVQEFRRSLDAFPLEYGEILRAHARVFGDDPFDGVSIAREDLRRACETQVKSHLVHLRESFIESGGRPKEIAELVGTSAASFAALLRSVARLMGDRAQDRTGAAQAGARLAGLPHGVVADLLAIEHPAAVPTTDAARLFPAYLDAVEQLAQAVDAWRP